MSWIKRLGLFISAVLASIRDDVDEFAGHDNDLPHGFARNLGLDFLRSEGKGFGVFVTGIHTQTVRAIPLGNLIGRDDVLQTLAQATAYPVCGRTLSEWKARTMSDFGMPAASNS